MLNRLNSPAELPQASSEHPSLRNGELAQPGISPREAVSIDAPLLQEVQEIIVNTLGIEDRAATLSASTPLFGSIPELDSLTVIELAIALETRFGFEIEDSELTAEVFETVGSLADYVRTRRA